MPDPQSAPRLISTAEASARGSTRVGTLVRAWRAERKLSQLALGLRAGVSTRHLSFVECGRSMPSADLILRLCDSLQVPLRERNQLLLAAGFAPQYPESGFASLDFEPSHRAGEP